MEAACNIKKSKHGRLLFFILYSRQLRLAAHRPLWGVDEGYATETTAGSAESKPNLFFLGEGEARRRGGGTMLAAPNQPPTIISNEGGGGIALQWRGFCAA
jgi:hypothetical protein